MAGILTICLFVSGISSSLPQDGYLGRKDIPSKCSATQIIKVITIRSTTSIGIDIHNKRHRIDPYIDTDSSLQSTRDDTRAGAILRTVDTYCTAVRIYSHTRYCDIYSRYSPYSRYSRTIDSCYPTTVHRIPAGCS